MALAVGISLVSAHAHAGMFEWIDGMFTFREDQKERVSPRRALPPKVILAPHYDDNAHAGWSNYYTRQDLVAQGYQNGSASKVMRPTAPVEAQGQYNHESGMAHSSAYIGDPGTGPGMAMSDANVGTSTRIGNPVGDWRRGESGDPLSSRPGDYNNRLHASTDDGYTGQRVWRGDDAGRVISGDGDAFGGDTGTDDQYTRTNSRGEVTQYRVQQGDTLSGIADQPRIYNDWKLWPLIYSANRKSIGRDPDNLHIRQKLDIPRDYTDSQERAAEKKALRRGQGMYGDGR